MFPNCATCEDLLKAIKDEKVQMIDLRFTDLPGVWQHFSVPPSAASAAMDWGFDRGRGNATTTSPFLTHRWGRPDAREEA